MRDFRSTAECTGVDSDYSSPLPCLSHMLVPCDEKQMLGIVLRKCLEFRFIHFEIMTVAAQLFFLHEWFDSLNREKNWLRCFIVTQTQ